MFCQRDGLLDQNSKPASWLLRTYGVRIVEAANQDDRYTFVKKLSEMTYLTISSRVRTSEDVISFRYAAISLLNSVVRTVHSAAAAHPWTRSSSHSSKLGKFVSSCTVAPSSCIFCTTASNAALKIGTWSGFPLFIVPALGSIPEKACHHAYRNIVTLNISAWRGMPSFLPANVANGGCVNLT